MTDYASVDKKAIKWPRRGQPQAPVMGTRWQHQFSSTKPLVVKVWAVFQDQYDRWRVTYIDEYDNKAYACDVDDFLHDFESVPQP